MEKFSLSGVTLSVFYDTRRLKEDLVFPVKYRVTYLRNRVYFPSGIDLTENEWKILPTTKKRELIETRELIIAGFDKIKDHIKEMARNEGFSIEVLTRRLSKGRENSIISAFDNKIYGLTKAGQIGTASTYQCAINSISKFTHKDLKLSDISIEWLRRYEAHLLNEGKTRTTIKFYIGCIRALMNEARQEKLITDASYPFGKGKFEIKTATGRKLALTLSQIKAVLDYPLNTDFEKRCRDLWFFSYCKSRAY